MSNKSSSNIPLVDASKAMTTSTWVLVVAEDPVRGALELQNCAANDILLFFSPAGQGAVAPTVTAGQAGVYCLKAAATAGSQGGSFEPAGGAIYTNAIWARGTTGDTLVCGISKPPV